MGQKQEWSDKMPDRAGLWIIRCGETNNENEYVAITGRKGRMIVHDPHLGKTPLRSFHDGLTQLRWLFVA